MSEWKPIETAPHDQTAVILYFANRIWRDRDGNPASMGVVRDHAERAEVGFFFPRLKAWCRCGTGHDYFEPWSDPEDLPTHWMPLPPPPDPKGEWNE